LVTLNKLKFLDSEKAVIISFLDWGLGHTTRCIPIIQKLIFEGKNVVVFCDKGSATIIKEEFPQLEIVLISGYNIGYSKNPSHFLLKIIGQLPKIYTRIQNEKRVVQNYARAHQVDLIISDNRFGFRNKKIKSVIISHQLLIKTGFSWLDSFVQKINYFFINQFDECWIPDIEEDGGLAGELSHPIKKPTIPIHYLGVLSRFKPLHIPPKIKLTILLSGPEPQRTILEKIIIDQLSHFNAAIVIVRGLPNQKEMLSINQSNITQFNHLNKTALNELICQSEQILARAGYSTIMDLVVLNKKAILIPTKGQTEQEFLARHLFNHPLFLFEEQDKLDLKNLLNY